MAKVKIGEKSRIVRKSNNLSSHIDNEVVILNVHKAEYSGLDEVGTDIWTELETPILINDLVSIMIEKYDVEKEQCALDVIEFVNDLVDNDLVDIVDGEK